MTTEQQMVLLEPIHPDRLYSCEHVSRLIGVRTRRKAQREGQLASRKVGRQRWYLGQRIIDFIEQHGER